MTDENKSRSLVLALLGLVGVGTLAVALNKNSKKIEVVQPCDGVCQVGEFCVNDVCVQCRNFFDCQRGFGCNNGVCERLPILCGIADNVGDEIDFSCPRGMQCTGFNGFCEPIPGFCFGNADCDFCKECVNDSCQLMAGCCEADVDCLAGQKCEGGLCVPIAGFCDVNNSCRACEDCLNNLCIQRDECCENADCLEGSGCNNGVCQFAGLFAGLLINGVETNVARVGDVVLVSWVVQDAPNDASVVYQRLVGGVVVEEFRGLPFIGQWFIGIIRQNNVGEVSEVVISIVDVNGRDLGKSNLQLIVE
ncbi:MAG: hypothetical protein Q7R52_02990 [archaeon]|nr:hypothetical protein [archaeon]